MIIIIVNVDNFSICPTKEDSVRHVDGDDSLSVWNYPSTVPTVLKYSMSQNDPKIHQNVAKLMLITVLVLNFDILWSLDTNFAFEVQPSEFGH